MIKEATIKYFMIILVIMSASPLWAQEPPINEAMCTALKEFNPKFVYWQTSDYSPTVQQHAIKDKGVPWSLTMDINADKKPDIILDGHDDQHAILLCLISGPRAYRVVVVRRDPLENPQDIESLHDGKKEKGLYYFLYTHKNSTIGFSKGYPQQSDASG